jgi:PilZ domain.
MAGRPTSKGNGRGAPPRLIGSYPATLRGPETGQQRIEIRNLSAKGLGARAQSKPPALGERVVITIDSLGEMKAMVKWVSRDLFGLHLFSSLSQAKLDALRGA